MTSARWRTACCTRSTTGAASRWRRPRRSTSASRRWAEIINCAASHAALHEEAAELKLPAAVWRDYVIGAAALTGPDEPALTEEGLLNAWLLADALTLDEAAMAGLAETCRADYPETWVVVQRLRRTIEYCRTHSGLRWRRGMVELLRYFDAMAREHHPTVLPPTQTILISLVLSEPQVKRPAERLFEIAPISSRVAGFLHKQDGSLSTSASSDRDRRSGSSPACEPR